MSGFLALPISTASVRPVEPAARNDAASNSGAFADHVGVADMLQVPVAVPDPAVAEPGHAKVAIGVPAAADVTTGAAPVPSAPLRPSAVATPVRPVPSSSGPVLMPGLTGNITAGACLVKPSLVDASLMVEQTVEGTVTDLESDVGDLVAVPVANDAMFVGMPPQAPPPIGIAAGEGDEAGDASGLIAARTTAQPDGSTNALGQACEQDADRLPALGIIEPAGGRMLATADTAAGTTFPAVGPATSGPDLPGQDSESPPALRPEATAASEGGRSFLAVERLFNLSPTVRKERMAMAAAPLAGTKSPIPGEAAQQGAGLPASEATAVVKSAGPLNGSTHAMGLGSQASMTGTDANRPAPSMGAHHEMTGTDLAGDTSSAASGNRAGIQEPLGRGSSRGIEAYGRHAAAADPAAQLTPRIAQALWGRSQIVSVQLHPAELGMVQIRIVVDAARRVSAIVSAEHPETVELLQRHTGGIERALTATGLALADHDGLTFDLNAHGDHQAEHGPEPGPDRQSWQPFASSTPFQPEGHPSPRQMAYSGLLDLIL